VTLFINMRRRPVGGGMYDEAYVVENATDTTLRGVAMPWPEVLKRVAGRRLLIHCHGFNVSMQSGIQSAVRMEQHLAPADDELFLAVLWPGDYYVKVVNYSFEYRDAIEAGRLLATFIDKRCGGARSVSLGSHSLGGRVVLEALAATGTRVDQMCLAAPAVDASCLSKRFAPGLSRVQRLAVLTSKKDNVLRWAYPLGDFFSDIFGDSDSALEGALGFGGPSPRGGPPVHWDPIPEKPPYDHGDYFPSGPPSAAKIKWIKSTEYWGRAMRGAPGLKWEP